MRKFFFLVSLSLFFVSAGMAGNVTALISFARFADPAKGPYLETYMNFSGKNLGLLDSEDGTYHSEVLVELTLDLLGKTVYSDQYRVISPSVSDTSLAVPDFVDLQRIPLKNGMYKMTIRLSDPSDAFDVPTTITQQIKMQHINKTYMSDVQIISGMTKSESPTMYTKVGYDLFPFASDFYSETMNELIFYTEFYPGKADKASKMSFLIDAYVIDQQTRGVVNNLRKYFKREAGEVETVLHKFPITQLSSGNYALVVELKDKNNKKLDSREFPFQRSNTLNESSEVLSDDFVSSNDFTKQYGDPTILKELIRCYYPIASAEEEKMIEKRLNLLDIGQMQKFMYGFWSKRNPTNPEADWKNYEKALRQVNGEYGSKQSHGCHTDRGRVYLQYGAPNSISKNYYEPSSYPYEIWHYYHVETTNVISQQNVKFVFARLEQGLQNFTLIHSTGEGEMNNPRWKLELHQRSQIFRDIDQEDTFEYHGGKATERFNNPY